MPVQLDPIQVKAVELCLDPSHRIVVISGPAGSGKTTIAKEIHRAFTAAGYEVALSAPTGRAARRQSEVTGLPASTNHKLLEFPAPGDIDPITGEPPPPGLPRRTKRYPISANVLLLDEGMMVDGEMYRYLIDALPPGGLLRIFGDKNQLKPITGYREDAPFLNFMKKFPMVELSTIHRQGPGSTIVVNGQRIINGQLPQRTEEFMMDIVDSPVPRLLATVATGKFDFSSPNFQIITPMNKNPGGTTALNRRLQALYQDDKDHPFVVLKRKEEKDPSIHVYLGDKVLQTKNDYNLEIMNGDIGTVIAVSETGELEVDFGWGTRVIPPVVVYSVGRNKEKRYDPRVNISLGYAITTHKAQGSEWQGVLYIVDRSTMYMANRTNFYTAITRARDWVHVFATSNSIRASVRPDKTG